MKAGFSLLEVVVAFMILALALGVLYDVAATNLLRNEQVRTEATLFALAKSQMELIGNEIPLRDTKFTRQVSDNTILKIEISKLSSGETRSSTYLTPFSITVRATRQFDTGSRSVIVETVQLKSLGARN